MSQLCDLSSRLNYISDGCCQCYADCYERYFLDVDDDEDDDNDDTQSVDANQPVMDDVANGYLLRLLLLLLIYFASL